MKRQYGMGLLVIDYLQLLGGSCSQQAKQNRTVEVTEMTRALKALAKEINIPVLCISQLSREVEKRDERRPQLADLRDSGSIEQDADLVMFIYRQEYYLSQDEPSQKATENDEDFQDRYAKWENRLREVTNTAEIIIAKQRHGPIGTEKVYFNPELMRFSDLEQGG